MQWVVDASFAATLFLPDEHTEISDGFFDSISEQGHIFVPHLWWHEITNVLVIAACRKRLSAQKSREVFALLEELPLTTIEITSYRSLFDIAITHQLSAYDATYLAMALEQKTGLASFDRALNKAARNLSIELI